MAVYQQVLDGMTAGAAAALEHALVCARPDRTRGRSVNLSAAFTQVASERAGGQGFEPWRDLRP
jgi:hypothetical protein